MILCVVELKLKIQKHLMYKIPMLDINIGVYKSSNYFVYKYVVF